MRMHQWALIFGLLRRIYVGIVLFNDCSNMMACASKAITLDEATDARWIKRAASRKREELR